MALRAWKQSREYMNTGRGGWMLTGMSAAPKVRSRRLIRADDRRYTPPKQQQQQQQQQQQEEDGLILQRIQLEHSSEVLLAHAEGTCYSALVCSLHNRSDHVMRAFPQHWRDDRRIMERICPHGIGHPDPDQSLPPGGGYHGCDGCCGW